MTNTKRLMRHDLQPAAGVTRELHRVRIHGDKIGASSIVDMARVVNTYFDKYNVKPL